MPSDEPEYSYDDADLDRFMAAARELVREAGEMIRAAIGTTNKAVDLKDEQNKEGNASSVLTETDTAVEKHLVENLKKRFPDHKFIGRLQQFCEEKSWVNSGVSGEEDISASPSGMVEEYSNNPTWIIDPIDGTMNFVHRNPLVCTSVGLAINRRVVLGLVANPMTGHVYTAIKGRGAYVTEGRSKDAEVIDKITTSGVAKLNQVCKEHYGCSFNTYYVQ